MYLDENPRDNSYPSEVVGAPPWHTLGTELVNLATAREAIEAADLNYTVIRIPWKQIPDSYLTVGNSEPWAVMRTDTGAVLGIVAGYTGASAAGSRPKFALLRGVAFLVGGIISMALIGALFGYAGQWVRDSLGSYWKIAAGVLAILFGIYTMDFLPFRLPGFSIDPKYVQGNILSAALFGLAVGGLTTALNTCCNPVFPVILAASFLKGSVIWGLLLLSMFALGYGLPMAAVIVGGGVGIGKLSGKLSLAVKILKYGGGIALVGLGFYFLITF